MHDSRARGAVRMKVYLETTTARGITKTTRLDWPDVLMGMVVVGFLVAVIAMTFYWMILFYTEMISPLYR